MTRGRPALGFGWLFGRRGLVRLARQVGFTQRAGALAPTRSR